ncbi:1-aminocyclopropane-1-carboxylate oxidase-1-like protein [Hordeum vulgare]|nr:1-aminocyclopropane-1-carboxylate oxidase-1-like protein [Hordeum vulgare]
MASDRLSALKAFDDTKAGVKGLVDAGATAIPAIFHHPPDSFTPSTLTTDVAVPVVDLSCSRSDAVGAVKAAAETAGFFLLANHGVPEAAMSGMLAAVRRFNEEPTEAKAPYYTRGRREARAVQPATPTSSRRWGVAPEYTGQMRRLGAPSSSCCRKPLGLPPGYLEEEAGGMEALSVAGHYYPACPEPHLTMGTVKHSDPSFLTVLLQDGVGGLQVLVDDDLEDAAWVDVPAVGEASLVVNVGDFLQLVSNDRFKSPVHRVVSRSVGPPGVGGVLLPGERRDGVRAGGGRREWPAAVQSVKAEEMLCVSNTQTRLNNLRKETSS